MRMDINTAHCILRVCMCSKVISIYYLRRVAPRRVAPCRGPVAGWTNVHSGGNAGTEIVRSSSLPEKCVEIARRADKCFGRVLRHLNVCKYTHIGIYIFISTSSCNTR